MKLVYREMDRVIRLEEGFVSELVIENKPMFFRLVNSVITQTEGAGGDVVLSVDDRPVEMSRYADVIVQFAPFSVNRKSLLTKLYNALEQKALSAEHYGQTVALLSSVEQLVGMLTEEYPFAVDCKKLTVGSVLRAVAPEIAESDAEPLEQILDYMELVRELDRDRLFIMVNMRSYFSDEDMALFIQSACSHDFRVLLLESFSFAPLPDTKRYTVDQDLCEF